MLYRFTIDTNNIQIPTQDRVCDYVLYKWHQHHRHMQCFIYLANYLQVERTPQCVSSYQVGLSVHPPVQPVPACTRKWTYTPCNVVLHHGICLVWASILLQILMTAADILRYFIHLQKVIYVGPMYNVHHLSVWDHHLSFLSNPTPLPSYLPLTSHPKSQLCFLSWMRKL